MRPRLLDLFCGAGGCSVGYHRAGFDVVGVDINPQPNYPYKAYQANALRVLEELVTGEGSWAVDAIHASPPCQAHSALGTMWNARDDHPELIGPTRELLQATGLPYVIENVEGAPLIEPVLLCGSMFGLNAEGWQLRRHRLFECSFPTMRPVCQHRGRAIGVYGMGGGQNDENRLKANLAQSKEAMDIDWMGRREISQAIPPAFTTHIGEFLMREVESRAAIAS